MIQSESYISYHKVNFDDWKLDNGDPFPQKKYFKNSSYDPETRTFKGLLDWRASPIWSDHTWNYEIKFSEDFKSFVGGHVICLSETGHQNAKGDYG